MLGKKVLHEGSHKLFELIHTYRSVRRQYRYELLAFRTNTNIFRFAVFSIVALMVSFSALIFVRPEIPAIRYLFLALIIISLLFFIFSVIFRVRKQEYPPFAHKFFIRAGVLLLIAWGTLQVFYGQGDMRGFVTYVGLIVAVAAVFSLEPLYYLIITGMSLVALFIIPPYMGEEVRTQIQTSFPFLLNSVIFGWVVSVMHYYTVLEIFYVKKQMEEEEQKADLALEGGNLGYWNWDIERETIYVDSRWLAMLGYNGENREIKFDEFFRMIVPEDRKRVAESVQTYFDGEKDRYTVNFRMETKEGSEKWIYTQGSVTERDREGKPLFMHGIHQDVQELREQELKLQESELRFRTYTENAPVGVFITRGLEFTYVNPEAIRITGYSEEELLDRVNLFTLIHPEDRKQLRHEVRYFLTHRGGRSTYLFRIISKTGETHWFETRVSTVNWKKREFLLSAVDITERKLAEERLKEYATYDELTGVFNRRVGLDLLEKEIHISQREGSGFTVCFIDVNGLKVVNDTLGHDEGDELIQKVVDVISREMRSGDILCRLGGDEFLLIFKACDMDNAVNIKQRIEQRFTLINRKGEKPYELSVSYGLLEYGREGELSVQEIIHLADQRMYEDKLIRKAQRKAEPSS